MSSYPYFVFGPLVLVLFIISLPLHLIQFALGIQIPTVTYYQIHFSFLLITGLLWIYSPLPDITMGIHGASGEYWGVKKVDLLLVIMWGGVIGLLLFNPEPFTTIQ